MKKIRILNVTFDTEIKGYEVPAFRGAVIAKTGKDNLAFHNHLNDNRFQYSYPLIQYKQINRRPAIVCVDEGVDEIHKFFENSNWDLEISGRVLNMKIERLQMNQFTMQVWDKQFEYTIDNWLALNQENYKRYQQIESLVERVQFLEGILKANILSFAKGIDWTVESPVEIRIKDIPNTRTVTLKQQKVLAFNLIFTTNVFIPNYIGLGKSVSLGFGVVKQLRSEIT